MYIYIYIKNVSSFFSPSFYTKNSKPTMKNNVNESIFAEDFLKLKFFLSRDEAEISSLLLASFTYYSTQMHGIQSIRSVTT